MIIRFPPGMRADASSEFTLQGLMSNANAYAEEWVGVDSTPTSVFLGTDAITLTPAEVMAKNVILLAGAVNSPFIVFLPPTSKILDALGPTVSRDGSFWFDFYIANQLTGRDAVLAPGDADTTVDSNNNFILNGHFNKWMVNVVPQSDPSLPLQLNFHSVFSATTGAGSAYVLTVTDGVTTVTPVTAIDFTSGATVTNLGGGTAGVAVSGGGGCAIYPLPQDFDNWPDTNWANCNYVPAQGDLSQNGVTAIEFVDGGPTVFTVWNAYAGAFSLVNSLSGGLTITDGFGNALTQIPGNSAWQFIRQDDSSAIPAGVNGYVGYQISGGAGLQWWIESHNASGVNTAIPVSNWLPKTTSTDADASMSPKGIGALLAVIPDGTNAGGDKRGTHAVDWQITRALSPRVASGDYSVIGGGSNNGILGGSTVADYAFIGGGSGNVIEGGSASYAAVPGGSLNLISGNSVDYSVIGGGNQNEVSGTSTDQYVTIGGGNFNSVSATDNLGNSADASYATIGGGDHNTIVNDGGTAGSLETFSTIGGGSTNNIQSAGVLNQGYNTIGGGFFNQIIDDATGTRACGYNFVGAGDSGLIQSGEWCGVVSGQNNQLTAIKHSVILGGLNNSIVGSSTYTGLAVIAGGDNNVINNPQNSGIFSGSHNTVAGSFSAVLTGASNTVNADNASVIAGAGLTNNNSDTALTKHLQFADAGNIFIGTTTGTQIGTAGNQKLALWGLTADVQPTAAIAAAAFAANTSGIANDTATFGGYTMGQVVAALKRLGVLA